jgi:uncharacterized membrane protein YdbT with pleckstrin-like domain
VSETEPVERSIRRYLLPEERLVATESWHVAWLVRPALVPLGALVALGWFLGQLPPGHVVNDGASLVAVAALARFAWQWLEWRNERLVVTDRRLLMVTGLLTRRVAVMPLRKVTDMTFVQPMVGRVLGRSGWGTFVFESAGQDQALHEVPYLRHPHELYQRLSGEIFGPDGIYGRKPPAGSPARPSGSDDDTVILW